MRRLFFYFVIIVLVLAACSPAGPEGAPPPPASENDPTSTQPATAEEEGNGPPRTPPIAPVGTPVVAPPLEAIYIQQPGTNSQVTSPVTVMGAADPTFEQNLVVLVTGEDGAQLALGPTTIQAPVGERGAFSIDMTFSVGSQQAGRISVYDISARDGGLVHLSSVEVTLLPGGAAQITQNNNTSESIAIQMPAAVSTLTGGTVMVSGYSDYYFESTLGVALCGAGGSGAGELLCGTADNALALDALMIQSPDVGQPGPFSGSVTYAVAGSTPARLALYATSPRDGGLVHVSSVPLTLEP